MKRILVFLMASLLLLSLTVLTTEAVLTQAVNNLAFQCEVVKSARVGEDVTFTDADFRQALGVESYPDLTILSLPDPRCGVLKLDKLRVSTGQVIPRLSIERLVFTPTSDAVEEANFTFRAGNLSGGAALTCSIRFTDKKNAAPEISGSAVTTFSTRKNASLWGTMACYDADGDELTYLVVSYPKHGTLTVTDSATGAFRYRPLSGYHGKDGFSYVVRDAYGSYSSIGHVEVVVDKRTQDFTITDISDDAAAHAALRMISANIMQAEQNGYAVYFHPSGSMTRTEFLVAAMKACGKSVSAESMWKYDDSAAIPAAAMPYIAEATQAGYVTPRWADGLYFRPEESVTNADAVAWLTAMCGACPVGITLTEENADKPLTRADAAVLLYYASIGRQA